MCCDLCDFYINCDEIDVINSNCCLECGEYNDCSGGEGASAYGEEDDFNDFDDDDDDDDDDLDDDDYDDDEDDDEDEDDEVEELA